MSDNVTSVQQQLSAVASNNTVNTWPQITPKPSSCVKCVLNSLKAGEECNCEWKEGCKRCERCEGLHAGCRVMPPAVRPEVARLFQLREQVEAFQQDSNTSLQELNRQRQVRQAFESQKTTVRDLIKALRADSGDNDYTLLNRKRHAFDDVGEWVPKGSKTTTQATTTNASGSGSSKMKTRSATRSAGGSGITTPAATQAVVAGPSGSTSQAASNVPGPQASVAPVAPGPPGPLGAQPGPIVGAQPNVGNVNNTNNLGLKDSNNNVVASVNQVASGDLNVTNNQSTTPHIAPHIAPAAAPAAAPAPSGNGKGKGKGKRKQDASPSQQGDNTTAPPAPKRARTRRGKTAQSIPNNNPSSSANNVGNLPLPAPAPIEPPAQQDPWHVYDDYLRQQVDPDVPPISPTSFMTEPESVRAVYAAGRGYLPLLSEYPPVARAREEESQSNYPLEPLMDAEELADYRRRQEEEDRRAGR